MAKECQLTVFGWMFAGKGLRGPQCLPTGLRLSEAAKGARKRLRAVFYVTAGVFLCVCFCLKLPLEKEKKMPTAASKQDANS